MANRDSLQTSNTGANERAEERPRTAPFMDKEPDNFRYATRKQLSLWFPGADPDREVAQTFRTWSSKRSVVLTTCSIVSAIVFITNIIGTIIFKTKYAGDGDLGTLYRGDCTIFSRLDLGLHLVTNLLSTLLTGSSNLCMQLLAVPTRAEVDKAHEKYKWLDIGVPSLRNLGSIAYSRRVLWALLALSSALLQFL